VPLPATPAHPNRPTRGLLALAFAAILLAGVLGGAIGSGIVDTSCTETPSVGDQLLDLVPDYEVSARSCDLPLLAGAIAGAAVAAIGAGIVAGLMLRAQSEWRAHPPDRPRGRTRDDASPVNPIESGESPPHT
jgi:hypothetical protein